MTDKQIRALKAIFVVLDALLKTSEEAVCVLNAATGMLSGFVSIPNYEIINEFIDETAVYREKEVNYETKIYAFAVKAASDVFNYC